jgi:glycosyltransferase involved in cell wall biosynthesis
MSDSNVAASPTPLVSIVTPSLNQGAYIGDAIESVLTQDYPRIEHIVVDGGSTDETLEVLARYPHLQWISEPDGGQADAVNKGFRLANGEIFGWLNADDLYMPGAVTAAVEAIRSSGCALVHGAWRQIDADGTVIRDVPVVPFDYRRQLEAQNRVCQPGAFFTREAFEEVGGLDRSYRYAMDFELWLKLGKSYSVAHVDRIQGVYRYHSRSKTVAEPAGFVAETWRASRTHGARLSSPLFLDYYLPRERPWLYRLLLAGRLVSTGNLSQLMARLRRRLPGSPDQPNEDEP